MIEVPSYGPRSARLAVLAESPGATEELEGRPLVGKTGRMFVRAVGGEEERERVWTGNVSRSRPHKGESDTERLERIARWRPHLEADLENLTEARTILTMGADALEAIVGVGGPQRAPHRQGRLFPGVVAYHGSAFTRREVDAIRAVAIRHGVPVVRSLPPLVHTVVSVVHYSFAMQGAPQFYPSISAGIARARAWSEREGGPRRIDIGIDDLRAHPDFLEAHLKEADIMNIPVAVDVETPLGSYDIKICGVYTNRAMSFQWSPRHELVMRDFFSRPGVVVGHNLQFDLMAFSKKDIKPGARKHCVDTLVAGAMIWPTPQDEKDKKRRGWLSLATCCARVLNDYAYHKRPENPATEAMYSASWPEVATLYHEELYNALDNVWCHRLWKAERELLQQEGML